VLGGDAMQFQVNGQDYFLKFVEDENRFYVFRATESGVDRYPVYVDAAKQEWAEKFRNGSPKIQ
jgi:hypothetical protein